MADVAKLPVLAEAILSDIVSQVYVCLVCTDHISYLSKVWSCHHCSRVFDLDCIQDWAFSDRKNKNSADGWRCPSCNMSHALLPKSYTCWCGKVPNPPSNMLEPHSCGYKCGAVLNDPHCPHGCSSICHPGPHQQKCNQMGPKSFCHCGKKHKETTCTLTPYQKGWSCGEICGRRLACGLHKCQKPCHSGVCDDCDIEIKGNCYCGSEKNEYVKCSEKNPLKSTTGDVNWIGLFQCNNICQSYLSCGIHKCDSSCHQFTATCHNCPLSVESITHCICGKSSLFQLGISRNKCTDPIPTCDKICGKTLSCGHKCYWTCHEGECAPCFTPVDMSCSCDTFKYSIACGLIQEGYKPQCKQKCNLLMSCRRHFCKNRCCADKPEAIKRENSIKKRIRKNELSPQAAQQIQVEAGHVCLQTCEKKLACGKHYCQAMCHIGPCPPCLESVFEDLECHCGKTRIPAPVRCGTKLPPCPFQCVREKDCGHTQEPHACHSEDVECTSCRQLVTKKCRCEKGNLMGNVVCSQNDAQVSCMQVCGKPAACGIDGHKCKKECHLPGNCQIACTEICEGKRSCGHKCKEQCHGVNGAKGDCPDTKQCTEIMNVTCKCGCRKMTLECWVVSKLKEKQFKDKEIAAAIDKAVVLNSEESETQEYAKVESATENNQNSISEVTNTEASANTIQNEIHKTDIDDELNDNNVYIPCHYRCEQQRRSNALVEVLGLSPEQEYKTNIQYQYKIVESLYTANIMKVMRAQPKWCLSIESIFRSLLIGKLIKSWGIDYAPSPVSSAFNSNANSPFGSSTSLNSQKKLTAGEKLLQSKQNSQSRLSIFGNSDWQSHHFRPMKQVQRKLVHELAEAWGLYAESQDKEPKRSVFVKAKSESAIPDIGLSDALAIWDAMKEIKKQDEESEREAEKERQKILEEAAERREKEREEQLRLQEEEKLKQELIHPKFWNAIMLKGISTASLLDDVDEKLKEIYQRTDLGSITSYLAPIDDSIWILIFELTEQHSFKEARTLLSKKVLMLCPAIEGIIIEKRIAQECIVCCIDDEVVTEVGDWHSLLLQKPMDSTEVIDIEDVEDIVIEDVEDIDVEDVEDIEVEDVENIEVEDVEDVQVEINSERETNNDTEDTS